jgi:hypothetical protein
VPKHSKLAENELARTMELATERKIIVSAHIALDFPGKGSIAVHVDGPSWVATPCAVDIDFRKCSL